MGSKRDTIVPEVEQLPQDDVVDLYGKLADQYRRVKSENEELQQQIYHSNQMLKSLAASQEYLQQELESIQTAHNDEIEEINRQHTATVNGLRENNAELDSDRNFYESKVDVLSRRVEELENELKAAVLTQKAPTLRVSDGFHSNLEAENKILQNSVTDLTGQLQSALAQAGHQTLTIEAQKEKIMCLEDNLETKKTEIGEKNDAIEVLQERNNEQALELAVLKTAPQDASRKGNSLFAEVDDQRQKMKSILQCERSHYLEMKKSFNTKELEIRRLKRENTNIKSEIQSCSYLLARGEQVAMQSLTARVNQLQSEKKKLESQLFESEKRLIDLAKDKNIGWIESLLSSANNESRDLKEKFFDSSMQNTLLADNFHKTQKELAKARLECVKYKVSLARVAEAYNIDIEDGDLLRIGDLALKAKNSLSSDSQDSLNESTIILLGGRERLGGFVPTPKDAAKKISEGDNKENCGLRYKEEAKEAVKPVPIKSPLKPLVQESALAGNLIVKIEKDSSEELETRTESPDAPNNASIPPQKGSASAQKASMLPQQASISSQTPDKCVKFSSKVSTAVIDSTQEQFEESQQARKRSVVVIKRIFIPSKPKKPPQ